jgi:NAD-dependent DNA ligase
MGWNIGTLDNTVKISAKCAKDLFETQKKRDVGIWYALSDVVYEGHVTFNSDHAEWMDWLGHEEVLVQVLLRHKVKGDICFGSMEGDNAGSFWGYRFDGEGGMTKLEGMVAWTPKGKSITAKPAKSTTAAELPGSIEGKTVVVTGALEGVTRDEANALIGRAGGIPGGAVTRKTNYLVVGDKPGSKVGKAIKLGVPTLTPEQFFALVGK